MAKLTFVAGKGGVGKTTVSCALGLHLAAKEPRASTLLMSTDPAHSLKDMLEIKGGRSGAGMTGPQRLAGVKGKLWLWQIDSRREFEKFLAGNREGILNIVESGTFFSKEEIAPLLDTTLPGMAEVAGLLAIQRLLESGEHEHIVVDTAPFGHTLRLFELPGHFEKFLDFLEVAASRDALLARRFGGRVKTPAHEFLARWQATVSRVKQAFRSRDAEILLVTTPETFSLKEAARSLAALEESGAEMRLGGVVLNRVVMEPAPQHAQKRRTPGALAPGTPTAGSCPRCRRRAQMGRKAVEFLKRQFPRVPRMLGPDPGNPLLGVERLKRFGDLVFGVQPGQHGSVRGRSSTHPFRKERGRKVPQLLLGKASDSLGISPADSPLRFAQGHARKTAQDGAPAQARVPPPQHAQKRRGAGDPGPVPHKTGLEARPARKAGKIEFVKTAWPAVETRLGFTVGKGGVGKTTTTAALAFHARAEHKDISVTVCSTDPAPSLDDIFQQPVGGQAESVLGDSGLRAVEIDSVGEFRRWARRIQEKLNAATSMETGGLHVDLTFEKQVFAALMDVVPPGVDEVFAIFRILDLLEPDPGLSTRKGGVGRVLIDMAPTGHALELLRMPERMLQWSRLLLKSLAGHRTLSLAQDVAVELAELGQRVRKLLEIMRDARQSRTWVVMLAEPVPDRQTERLLAALEELGMAVEPVFVNRVLLGPQVRCGRCERAREWQLAVLAGMRKRRMYVLREFPAEIAGAEALNRFTNELWAMRK